MTAVPSIAPALDLSGRSAVVTGAGAGIGRAAALRLAQAGAAVAVIDINGEAAHDTCARIAALGGAAAAYAVSVTDQDALLAAARDAQERLGPCGVLVNNAGVLLRSAFTDPRARDFWTTTLDVNLNGPYLAAQAFYPQLRATRGCIVNIASIHSFVAVKNSAAYTASKGGIKQMTQALALELGADGIRVNAVAPGLTVTDMTRATVADPEGLTRFLARVPLARPGSVDDVVNAICFLASDWAAYITGVTLPVDGGYVAN